MVLRFPEELTQGQEDAIEAAIFPWTDQLSADKQDRRDSVTIRTKRLIEEKMESSASWDAWQAASKTCFDDGLTLKTSIDAAVDKSGLDAITDTRA